MMMSHLQMKQWLKMVNMEMDLTLPKQMTPIVMIKHQNNQ